MLDNLPLRHFRLTTLIICAAGLSSIGCADPPTPSTPARPDEHLQRLLLNSLSTPDAAIGKAGYQLSNLAVEAAPDIVAPKIGDGALAFRGTAKGAGSKGDFTVAGAVPGRARTIGVWVYLTPESNVESVGFQTYDAQGEALLFRVHADWTGWKRVEMNLDSSPIAQAYKQADKNGAPDFPLRDLHIAWFAKSAGPTSLIVNELTATTQLDSPPALSVAGEANGASWGESGKPFSSQLAITNYQSQEATARVEYSLQRVASLWTPAAPDPIDGLDHALGAKSWTEVNGKTVEEGSLTDGKDYTNVRPDFGPDKGSEAFQFVDLGRARRITRLNYLAGDANWISKVDIAASSDGKEYSPVAGLQSLDLYKKWGQQTLPVGAPFEARFLRIRYHKDGEKVNNFAMFSALSVFDGVADENWNLPNVGEVVASGMLSPKIGARDYASVAIKSEKPLETGAYLIAERVEANGKNQLLYRHFLVMPAAMKEKAADSLFGLNSSQTEWTPSHERLGIGWVRFENMKWPMLSSEPDKYKFDGSIAPWHVNADEIMASYTRQGLRVLPFLFLTADYASSAGSDVAQGRRSSYPPKDNALMADFVFQTAARYGATKHPASELKTDDKKSGLNQINVFEIWNEPNLTAPSWGPWVGTTAQYLDMFRPAAEAVKKADPTARVTNGGYAGIAVETVDALRTHTYADGKHPLDFVDILNVHYYSGRVAPEIATVDTNVDRSGKKIAGRTYEESLQRLVTWRDTHKPQMPIWLTETGYDSAGPFGTNEQFQAARLPRVVMMSLAAGIDKVFVYREAGSTLSQHAASGLFRNDGSLKPSWFSYATLIRQLDGAKNGMRLPYPDANVRLYAWKRGAETILSAWTVEGAGRLKLNMGKATVTDAFGSTQQINSANELPLSDFPIYIKDVSNMAGVDMLIELSRREVAARRAERESLAKKRAYLFDFGGTEKVGTLDVGTIRSFTPVLSTQIYSEDAGYGFFPGAAMQDSTRAWLPDPLETDMTRVGKGQGFRFKVASGRYRLTIGASSLGGPTELVVKGGADGDKTLTFTHDGPPASADIAVNSGFLSIEAKDYADVRWLSLVEQ